MVASAVEATTGVGGAIAAIGATGAGGVGGVTTTAAFLATFGIATLITGLTVTTGFAFRDTIGLGTFFNKGRAGSANALLGFGAGVGAAGVVPSVLCWTASLISRWMSNFLSPV